MPRLLSSVERLFERILERPAARVFRTRLQPVQIQRRLERAMDGERRIGADKTYVPNRYRVRLCPADAAAFDSYRATLENELGEALLERARSRAYTLVERPRVTIEAAESVPAGEVEVEAEVIDPLLLRPAPAGFRRVADADGQPGEAGGGPPALEQTAVFDLPPVRAPRVRLLVRGPDGTERTLTVQGGMVRVGRAADNDLVLADDRVSRHHGQFSARQGALVYRDLDSSNGSFVNGSRVTEIALGPDDVLQLGGSTLTIVEEA
ncbi:MAG TPA: DUF3662 and FHA domain-containing protein [Candidatus Limnocylindrales bacterium]|nr:DUF3662 and FHA domain-containing protein [Candidatus Limnocylindrales bacterium]